MAALEFGERVPVPIEQLREDLRFHFALLQLFVALLVARVVFAIGINRRHEHDVLSIRRPDRAVGAGRDVRDLMRLSRPAPRFRSRSRTSRFASDRSLSMSRSSVCRPAKSAAALREFGVSFNRFDSPPFAGTIHKCEIFVFASRSTSIAIEHDPFPIRRRHRLADAFEFHHVLERERMLAF